MSKCFLVSFVQIVLLYYGCQCSKFVGCYKKETAEFLKQNGGFILGPKQDLKPDSCKKFCDSHDMSYAGLQGSNEQRICYCSNERPPFTYTAESDYCKTPKGVEVYEIDDGDNQNYVDGNHFACYKDDTLFTIQDSYQISYWLMTPELCVGYCYRKGRQFAGLLNGNKCICGNGVQGNKGDRFIDCNAPCTGNDRLSCGGQYAIDVYQTHDGGDYTPSDDTIPPFTYPTPNHTTTVSPSTTHPTTTATPSPTHPTTTVSPSPTHPTTTATPSPTHPTTTVTPSPTHPTTTMTPSPTYPTTTVRPSPTHPTTTDRPSPTHPTTTDGPSPPCTTPITPDVTPDSERRVRLVGCYGDNSSLEAPFFPGEKIRLGVPTVQNCLDYCVMKKYTYAGLGQGFECWCSNERPSYEFAADVAECNVKCQGNKTETCGGYRSLSVYDLNDKYVNYVQQKYVGCYEDEGYAPCRPLDYDATAVSDLMTPEFCLGFCYRHGFVYGGVHKSNQCFCGNAIRGTKANEGQCDADCTGSGHTKCGGTHTSSIYRTSIAVFQEI